MGMYKMPKKVKCINAKGVKGLTEGMFYLKTGDSSGDPDPFEWCDYYINDDGVEGGYLPERFEDAPISYIVFGKTRERAVAKLEELIGNIPYNKIKNIKKPKSGIMYVELVDGTTYKALPLSQYARGYKCDIVYVNRNAIQDDLNSVVYGCLCSSIFPQDKQIIYFD